MFKTFIIKSREINILTGKSGCLKKARKKKGLLASSSIMATYVPLMAVLGLLVVASIIGVVILAGSLSIRKVSSLNGFHGDIKDGVLTMSTTVDGLIKGENGALTAATPQDITKQPLTGFSTEGVSGDVTANDSILSGFAKLARPGGGKSAVSALVWNQTSDVLDGMHFNAYENRAIPIPVIKNYGENFNVDQKTGFSTFIGEVATVIQVNYVITLQLPDKSAVAVQHFVSLNPNASWMFASPTPSIDLAPNQTYTETAVTPTTAATTTTVVLNTSLLIQPQQGFGLCGNELSTNASTIYKHVSCIVSY